MNSSGRTLVIINPISGTKSKEFVQKQIEKHLRGSRFDYRVEFTKGPFHATDLARKAADEGCDFVIAAGGDGTVNEVASGLINTGTALGILPIGSGNGLGKHFGIPGQPGRALRCLLDAEVMPIDVCTANGHPFFNVAGAGYDALVAHEFAKRPDRGFAAYVQTVLDKWFKYKPKKFKVHTSEGSFKVRALLVSVANGSQFGNNAWIAPGALIDDGLMDVCILEKFPNTAIPKLAFQLFNKRIEKSGYLKTFKTGEVIIKQKSKKVHLDGEPYKLGKKIHFKVMPKALNILAPKAFYDEFHPQHTFSRSR